MGLFAKLKQFLPPSSRSFHGMYREMVESNWVVKDTGLKLYEMDARFNERLDQLERRLDAHDAHVKMLEWANYRRDGESFDDARRRFYRELPQATGSLRLLQLGNAQLIREFDALCKQHGLTYWVESGTLLGAMRHQGFIPWDDDVDLSMTRQDILRLMDVVRESERFRVTVVYDWYVHCRQVRFRYRDELVPCFLDLFIYDHTPSLDAQILARQSAQCDALVAEANASECLSFWSVDDACVDTTRSDAQPIRELFDRYVDEAFACGDCVTEDAPYEGILYALDNYNYQPGGAWRLLAKDEVFPLRTVRFEGMDLPAPRQAELILQRLYGDYLELPGDLHSHAHVAQDELSDSAHAQAIQEKLDEAAS